ncbi:MAG TPA: DedA family protein [Polyangiaceae bacterium]|jgi:membrane protein DedA with SNARE-associated domain|nr:DedA family protein [Polyangiaceae bacterium]
MLEYFVTAGSLPILVLAVLIAGYGVPIPEDAVLLAAGVLSQRGTQPWWLALPVMYAAIIGADCILFFVARRVGEAILTRRPLRWIATPTRRVKVAQLFQTRGPQAIFLGRYMAGLRAVVFALAAIEGVPFATFLAFDALAGVITVPLVFALGYLFSSHVAAVQAGLAQAQHWMLASIGLIIILAIGLRSWRQLKTFS